MTVELSELSLHLGDFIKKAQAGEFVVIREHGVDVAELHPPAGEPLGEAGLRPFGIDKGKVKITDAFFEPLPDDLLRAFNGEDPDAYLDSKSSK